MKESICMLLLCMHTLFHACLNWFMHVSCMFALVHACSMHVSYIFKHVCKHVSCMFALVHACSMHGSCMLQLFHALIAGFYARFMHSHSPHVHSMQTLCIFLTCTAKHAWNVLKHVCYRCTVSSRVYKVIPEA